jgi:hypothetical protein
MTVLQLKRSMDARFRLVDRRFAQVDRRLAQIDERITREAVETRRHFALVAESLRDDFRIFADAIARRTERLDQHDVRIGRLERERL